MGKSHQCFMCQNMDRFYINGDKKFDRTKCGWCRVKVDVVQIHESCEKFRLKKKRERYTPLLKKTLESLLTEISEVRKVLEAENEDIHE